MKLFKQAQKYGAQVKAGVAKTGALALMGMASVAAHAQETGGPAALFDSVDLSGISGKITAMAILIVGICFVIKGPSIVKRVVNKI